MSESYGAFASVYDLLTEDVEYAQRGEYFISLIEKFGGKRDGVLLDLACGTGSLSEIFAQKGFRVTGADISPDMLAVAENKRVRSGSNIRYICQDMCELELGQPADVTVCALDSLNHLEGIEEVRTVFEKVYEYTSQGGLFIFDMNTLYKHHEVLADNTFVFDEEEVYLVWQNFLEGDRVDISLDFFIPDEKGRYRRFSEDFSETAYPADSISRLLRECGFEVLGLFGENSLEPPDDCCERVIYIAKKEHDNGNT